MKNNLFESNDSCCDSHDNMSGNVTRAFTLDRRSFITGAATIGARQAA